MESQMYDYCETSNFFLYKSMYSQLSSLKSINFQHNTV